MRIHFLLHADFEQPSYYKAWAKEKGFHITSTHIHKCETLPSHNEYDLLVSMGGPQSPLKLDHFPYLKDEIQYIKKAIDLDKHVIGVCLGAQLISESYGATTERSPNKEIGVFPLTLTDDGKQDPIFKHFPDTFPSGHWHNDMPGLPPNAKVLAVSQGCPRQIIRFSPKVMGFQCHLEFDKQSIQFLINICPNDLSPNKYVQSADVILSQDYAEINNHLKIFLEHFINDLT